jgi:beta-phosphoglucomutase-like phosphatase (HAD superfamily)
VSPATPVPSHLRGESIIRKRSERKPHLEVGLSTSRVSPHSPLPSSSPADGWAALRRLVGEAIAAGVPVAVCSTSSEQAVSTIVRVLLGAGVAGQMPVYAGDAVPKKKPSPDIYLLAARQMGACFTPIQLQKITCSLRAQLANMPRPPQLTFLLNPAFN